MLTRQRAYVGGARRRCSWKGRRTSILLCVGRCGRGGDWGGSCCCCRLDPDGGWTLMLDPHRSRKKRVGFFQTKFQTKFQPMSGQAGIPTVGLKFPDPHRSRAWGLAQVLGRGVQGPRPARQPHHQLIKAAAAAARGRGRLNGARAAEGFEGLKGLGFRV